MYGVILEKIEVIMIHKMTLIQITIAIQYDNKNNII